ncbi:MAG: DUF5818 domain-containing protein [Terracidiphilus sp.]
MRSIRHDLLYGSALSALALAFALAWGGPFFGAPSAQAQEQAQPQQQEPQQQPDQAQPQQQAPQQQPDQSQATTFTGTVVKSGGQYALRDSSGAVYKLDDSERAKPFEGKAVKVTGQLDQQAMVIHVESIESAEG